jgi:hypothetical protein
MKFTRTENDPHQITVADGEAGRGVYFSLSTSVGNYYKNQSPQGRRITAIASKDCQIIDFRAAFRAAYHNFILIEYIRSRINKLAKEMAGYIKPRVNKKNYQRFGRLIEDFLNEFYPKTDGYIVYHGGPNIPSGAQLVVRNLEKFILVE